MHLILVWFELHVGLLSKNYRLIVDFVKHAQHVAMHTFISYVVRELWKLYCVTTRMVVESAICISESLEKIISRDNRSQVIALSIVVL